MMIKCIKRIAIFIALALFLTGSAVFHSQTVWAASEKSCTLVPGKKKAVQLDGKGAAEKLLYTFKNEETERTDENGKYYKHILTLAINDETVFEERVTNAVPETIGDVYITDIDRSDGVKDIFIAMYNQEYVSKYDVLYYCRYRDGKFVKVQDLKKYLYSGVLNCFGETYMDNCHPWYGGLSHSIRASDKQLQIMVCGYTHLLNIDQGCYFHAMYPLKLKNGKLKKASEYPKGQIIEADFDGSMAVDCTFYKKPGSRQKAFVVKKGENVTISSYQFTDNKLYIKAVNNHKTAGWCSGKVFVYAGTLHA